MKKAIRKTMKNTTRISAMLIGLALTLLVGGVSAQAESTPVTTCGQELAAPGQYHLTGNLGPCPGDGVMITASGVDFTLAGFTISGLSSLASCDVVNPQHGINIMGPPSGVHVHGGTVTGFVDGVVLGATNSRVSAMTLTDNCIFGIAASGADNVIDTNWVTGSGVDGIALVEAQNILIHSNYIARNVRAGIDISGFSNNNTIRSNILHNNGIEEGAGIAIFNGNNNTIVSNAVNRNFSGILLSVAVSGNLIEGNTVNGNSSGGISITNDGTMNVVRGNTARGNGGSDLSDANPGCATNTWTSNIFETDSVAGIPDGGPEVGCIR